MSESGETMHRAIPRREAETEGPLSFGQELFWRLDQASPGLTAYNVPRAFRIRGPLDEAALGRALDALVARHAAFRTVFGSRDDQPFQRALAGGHVELERVDLSGRPAAERDAALRRAVDERAARPVDLAAGPLLRAGLIILGPDDRVLFLLTHHIVFDGWSRSVLLKDLSALYDQATGRPVSLPPLPIQFGDYAAWERATLTGQELERRLAFWRTRLAGPLLPLDLPTDRPRPTGHTFDGDVRERILPNTLVTAIRALGQAHGATPYMVLLAAYQTLLHRYSGQDDIIVGSPTAGREQEETHGLIGYFSNTLPMRTSFAGDPTFTELLERVSEGCLDAFEHQDVPLETLTLELRQGAKLSPAPLFQCVLTMEDTVPAALSLGGAAVTALDVAVEGTKFDLTLLFGEHPEGLRLRLGYRTALFDGHRIERMLDHLERLLSEAVADPSRRVSALPMLTTAELAQLDAWQGRQATYSSAPVAAAIGARAAENPERIAVTTGARSLSYGQLDSLADQLGQALVAAGVRPGSTVGVLLDREPESIAAVLGIWRAGAAYVPLLPDLPPARIARLLTESAAAAVVTTNALRGAVPAGVPIVSTDTASATGSTAALPVARADGMAYVLFTSGSTGVPKGVAVTHANLAHYTNAISERLGLDGRTPWSGASVSTLAADLGHTAVFPTLAAGGTLHLIPTAVAMEPARWAAYTAEHRLDLLKITPSHLRALVGDASGPALAALLPARWLVLGGEAAPVAFAATLRGAGQCRVLNHYGPTETTVGACTYAPDEEATPDETLGSVPIGRPLPNLRAEVRGANGQVQPIGVPGDLWVGGPQVANGYLGRPELTAERFATDERGIRWYRTGDRVRRLSTGALEFLGRLDAQVKIRGYRVELEEVERTLAAVPGVSQAAVRLHDETLAAYVVADPAVTDGRLTDAARAALPDYMVPASWTRLDRLPLNANGKVDRAALPAPASGAAAAPPAADAPRGPVEIQLAALWAEVLKREGIGRDANFFALGGHSLLAIRLLGRVSKTFGVRLALRQLFDAPTVAQLAAVIAPPHPLEGPLTALWAEILKRDQVGRDENFFSLGGHSLLAIRLLGRISKQFGVRLALRDLFDAPTVAQLAEVVGAAVAKVAESQEMAALLADLQRLAPEEAARLVAEPPTQTENR